MCDIPNKICVAVVAEDDYFLGLLVTIRSFLKKNQWFDGDLVVFDAGLSAGHKKRIRKLWKSIVFRMVPLSEYSTECAKTDRFPKRLLPAFYKFEFFGLDEYDFVIGLDADLLIQGDLSSFLGVADGLGACAAVSIESQINTGVLAIGNKYLSRETVDMLRSGIVKYAGSVADQDVISSLLYKDAVLLDRSFNAIKQVWLGEGIPLGDEMIIHYTGKKPWQKWRLDKGDELWVDFYKSNFSWLLWVPLLKLRLTSSLKFRFGWNW